MRSATCGDLLVPRLVRRCRHFVLSHASGAVGNPMVSRLRRFMELLRKQLYHVFFMLPGMMGPRFSRDRLRLERFLNKMYRLNFLTSSSERIESLINTAESRLLRAVIGTEQLVSAHISEP